MRNQYNSIIILACYMLSCTWFSCSKQVSVDSPVTNVTGDNAFKSDATAIAVLTALYSNMSSEPISTGGFTSTSFILGIAADELTLYPAATNGVYLAYYQNNLSSTNTQTTEFWTKMYPAIYTANAVINALSTNSSLTPAVAGQLLGEAKFMRAFSYFYLVNLYGDVPLVLTTDYTVNATIARTDKAVIWQQIIQDLTEAQNLLNKNYVDITLLNNSGERVRPTKAAASALLARSYLYTGEWEKAEAEATSVIDNKVQYDTASLNNVFVKNSKEAIWQLQPVIANRNTQDAQVFILTGAPTSIRPVYLPNSLLNAFETGDARKANWVASRVASSVTYYYPFKYKASTITSTTPPTPPTEYAMVLRLGEQYLIRAEARAQQNKIELAKDDLNLIRNRARLGATPANDKSSLLSAILRERRVELFTEWGHRWLDLKRTGNIDAVMGVVTPQKSGSWDSYKHLFPIPIHDVRTNPNMVQNTGY